jgi:hypothetical protein
MLWAGLTSIVFVSLLTILLRITMSGFFFYPLFPGEMASILITGGHGGTDVEELGGTVVGIVVNAFVYFAVFWLLVRLLIRMRAGGPDIRP